jgi:nucleotidyltransferase/DNA polymerase involved in DNA repair
MHITTATDASFCVVLQYGDLRTVKPSANRLFPDSNGSIIAVSYEARKHGVKR